MWQSLLTKITNSEKTAENGVLESGLFFEDFERKERPETGKIFLS